MNNETIKRRVAAREAAVAVAELVVEQEAALDEDVRSVYWQKLSELFGGSMPKAPDKPKRAIVPMSDKEAQFFEKTVLSIGNRHYGEQIGTVLESEPDYLDYLVRSYEDQTTFFIMLRRYLLNKAIVDTIGADYDGGQEE